MTLGWGRAPQTATTDMGFLDWLRGGREAEAAELEQWRLAWAAAAARVECGAMDRLRADLQAVALPDDEVEVEREMLEGLAALCLLRASAERDGLPVIETGHRAAAGVRCHFSAPVSMPDEPGQPSGRLLLTEHRAVFAGPGHAIVPWHAVAHVIRAERDLLLVDRGRDRTHRFRCNSYADALTGAFISERLTAR
jgi:hypothetical protein